MEKHELGSVTMKKLKLKVKAIIFDLDGTIVDSREAYFEAAKIAFKTMGKGIVNAGTVMEIPKRLEQNLSIEDLLDGISVQKFLKVYLKAYYQLTYEKAKPISSISHTLQRLSERVKLALITMRYIPKEKVVEELEKLRLREYFKFIITALDTSAPKPSPKPLIECAKNLGVQACECAIVGDSIIDIRTGKAAGAKTIAVLSGIFSRKELEREKPDLILENVNQLPDFVE